MCCRVWNNLTGWETLHPKDLPRVQVLWLITDTGIDQFSNTRWTLKLMQFEMYSSLENICVILGKFVFTTIWYFFYSSSPIFLYRLEDIEANNQAYLNRRVVAASPAMLAYLQQSRSDTQQQKLQNMLFQGRGSPSALLFKQVQFYKFNVQKNL